MPSLIHVPCQASVPLCCRSMRKDRFTAFDIEPGIPFLFTACLVVILLRDKRRSQHLLHQFAIVD
jgi:hypothetical protein